MKKINKETLDLIKTYEGLRFCKYKCPGGYYTIGYGHKLNKNEDIECVTQNEAEELLFKDIEIAEKAVKRLINNTVNENQFGALVSFAYNCGAAALQRSTLRQKVNRGEHDYVPMEFMKWVKSNGKTLRGLIKRREMEVDLYCSA